MESSGALTEGASPEFFTNLLVNPDAEAGSLSGWTLTDNGGAGWAVYGDAGSRFFRTSYTWNQREQLVDLWAHGFSSTLMNEAPLIHVSERFQRTYCPDDYSLEVELLDFDMQVVASWSSGVKRNSGECKWGDEVWDEESHTFKDYGPGVRYVRWKDAGTSSEYWGGHYGVAMDDARLVVLDHNHPAFHANLLSNSDAEKGDMTGWTVTENGGAGWAVTGDAGSRVFRTSYQWNRRQQLVDLWKWGFTPETMAQAPLIVVGEQFQRTYCPDNYYLRVQLLDEKMNVVASYDSGVRTNTGSCQWGDEQWDRLIHAFADYGPRVRYVRWEDGGKDREFWGGHYGVLMDKAFVVVLGHNLLENPGAGTGDLTGWNVLESGGDGWGVTSMARDGIAGNLAFRTSNGWSRRSQLVDLIAKGYSADVLDDAPPFFVSEHFRGESCPDSYFLKVELLDESQQVVASFDSGILTNTGTCQAGAEPWDHVFHAFTGYGPGVRYVRWEDGGKDSESLAGFHGAVLDGAYLGLEDPRTEARHQQHRRTVTRAANCGGEGELPCRYDRTFWFMCIAVFNCSPEDMYYYECMPGLTTEMSHSSFDTCHLVRTHWTEKQLADDRDDCHNKPSWTSEMSCWQYDDQVRDELNMDSSALNFVTTLYPLHVPTLDDGRYIYVYHKQTNRLRLRRYDRETEGSQYDGFRYLPNVGIDGAYKHVRHSQLNGGWAPVWCAGELFVEGGRVCRLNNASGHFQPPVACLEYVEKSLIAWHVPLHIWYRKGNYPQVKTIRCPDYREL
ncbi:hypothetical protein [Pyxidicoccus sp. MSG2]|uniref:hypothetical protein n=1 Tax=Pyxidicoccus sp. MSG2 TaxID=2996790 RepID=UPI00226FAA9F|nr:hypothetical protein [Pyxidicoccus sp. MSG2]MCY1022753.1 hypothetical protein [Pyxidicoccus sp. MSG2]